MKTIKSFDIEGKKVIIRCDFNVPLDGDRIMDDHRIKQSLKTINYAIKKGAKVIILAHLGRVKTEEDLIKYDLKPISKHLSKLLNQEVIFSEETRGRHLKALVRKLKDGEVLLIQNTRYEDLEENKESGCDTELSKYWASLGDIFINDAFGAAHRKHASNVGISKYLPSGIGFLMEKEIKYLNKVLKKPDKPYTVILGGKKISDKITVCENLVKKADYILIGGAMAFTFLKAAGFEIGLSMYEKDKLDFCTSLLSEYDYKIILPVDIVVTNDIKDGSIETKFINEIGEDEIGLDIGNSTLNAYKRIIENSKTIFYNGAVGYFENEKFANGTKGLFEILAQTKAEVIIGGGDTTRAAINMGYQDKFTHISTGGGASLEFLEGKTLPALAGLNEKKL